MNYMHVYNCVILNVFFFETAWAIFTIFHIDPYRKGIDNFFEWFCAIEQDGCHILVWYKNLKIFFSNTKKGKRKVQGMQQSQTAALPRHQEEEETNKSKQALNLGIQHRRLKIYLICSNDGRRLIFDLSVARSKLHPHIFYGENVEKSFFLSGSVVEQPLCDREVAGSIPGRVIPKTLKTIQAVLSLGAQQ